MRGRTAVFIGFTLLTSLSCKRASEDTTSGPNTGSFDKVALLRSFGTCAIDTYRTFQTAAVELDAAAAQSETDALPTSLERTKESWKKAIDAWQVAEVFQFGPAAVSTSPGGQDLRDAIYAWPLVDRCAIEQKIVSQGYAAPDFASSLVESRTLAAAEVLLFADTPSSCAAGVPSDGAELAKRKAAYVHVLTRDVVLRGQKLADAWDPAKGNFLAELETAGSGKTFTTQQMAFNAVSDSFFYADDFMKNMKVGKPAALLDCGKANCLDTIESPWAKRSKKHLENNLAGFEKLLVGCDGKLGWSAYLAAAGGESTGKKLRDEVSAVRTALAALTEATLADDIAKNPAGVQALFDSLRALVVTMKTELVSVLDLELPKRVIGDND